MTKLYFISLKKYPSAVNMPKGKMKFFVNMSFTRSVKSMRSYDHRSHIP